MAGIVSRIIEARRQADLASGIGYRPLVPPEARAAAQAEVDAANAAATEEERAQASEYMADLQNRRMWI